MPNGIKKANSRIPTTKENEYVAPNGALKPM
jgi:hypothetical protein